MVLEEEIVAKVIEESKERFVLIYTVLLNLSFFITGSQRVYLIALKISNVNGANHSNNYNGMDGCSTQ